MRLCVSGVLALILAVPAAITAFSTEKNYPQINSLLTDMAFVFVDGMPKQSFTVLLEGGRWLLDGLPGVSVSILSNERIDYKGRAYLVLTKELESKLFSCPHGDAFDLSDKSNIVAQVSQRSGSGFVAMPIEVSNVYPEDNKPLKPWAWSCHLDPTSIAGFWSPRMYYVTPNLFVIAPDGPAEGKEVCAEVEAPDPRFDYQLESTNRPPEQFKDKWESRHLSENRWRDCAETRG